MKKYLFIFSILLISCQEEITLDLSQAEDRLVVEGSIEPGFPPYVILTKNQGYFDPINQDTYTNLFVNDVDSIKVWYYNNGEKEMRILQQIPAIDTLNLPPIYTDLNYTPGNYNFSQSGRTYYLEIQWRNQLITSETTIPEPTPLDSLWVEQSETADKDFKCDIRAVYSDPADIQNNILIRSKRLQHYKIVDSIACTNKDNPDFILKLVDAGSDVLIDGQSFETYFPRPGENGFPTGRYNSYRTKECNNGSILEFAEDVVLIKFCQIDEPSMKFWRSLVRQFGTNGNPFSEPMNLVSNINNGLGVWTGYGAVYYKVPIIKDTTIFEEYTPEIIDIF
jgi:hypothetical protein